MPEPYFAPGYLRVLYRYLRSEGVTDSDLFLRTGLSERELMRTETEASFTAQMRFCENALTLSPPGLGLRAGRQLQLAAHGTLGTAMQTSENLRTALHTIADFLPSRASFYEVSFEEAEQRATFRVNINGLPDLLVPFFTETLLLTLIYCVAHFSGRQNQSARMQVGYEDPGYAASYKDVFGVPVRFAADHTEIALDQELLDLSSPEFDPIAHEDSVRRCTEQISKRLRDTEVCQGIETFLFDNPGRLWSLEEIAPLFASSPRTLIRRLKVEGTTYQALRDSVLKQQAKTYLNTMTVETAALALGFADTSSFRRTFKRWHGVPPGAATKSR